MFNHRAAYSEGSRLLKVIGWVPNPSEMFRAPSRAKGKRLHLAALKLVSNLGTTTERLMDAAQLAARIDHFTSIGGRRAVDYFLGDHCRLDVGKIARLSRRMPPFIKAKLKYLYAGSINIDSNPTGAFDTNGWPELRVRLPKFGAMMQHYAQQMPKHIALKDKARLMGILEQIQSESRQMLLSLKANIPDGRDKPLKSDLPSRKVDWSVAATRFAQALGVLRKCNRDLASVHWKKDWIPIGTDLTSVTKAVEGMRTAAQIIHDHIAK